MTSAGGTVTLQEIAVASFTGDAPAQQSLGAYDIHTSAHVRTYKQTCEPPGGIAIARSSRAIYAAQTARPHLHVYSWSKEAPRLKTVLPEKLGVISVSHSELWLAAGAETGRLILWEVSTGALLFARSAHYQTITHCCFSHDDSVLITGSKDSRILVWRLVDLVSYNEDPESIKPIAEITDHTLPIAGLFVGAGTYQTSRLFTASADMTVKIRDLRTTTLLSTLLFPAAITCMDIDSAERSVFVGSEDTVIRRFNLYGPSSESKGIESVIDSGAPPRTTAGQPEYKGHDAPITCVKLSFDSSLLVSGDQSGNVLVWEISSQQMISKLSEGRGICTSIHLVLMPSNIASMEDSKQVQDIVPLSRAVSSRKAEDLLIKAIIAPVEHADTNSKTGTPVQSSSEAELQRQVDTLKSDLEKVRGHYNELKDVHEELWEIHRNQQKEA